MSLINEALRKVQSQRTEAPGLGSENGNPPSYYSERSNRYGLTIVLGGCIVILIGLVVGLTVILFSDGISWSTKEPTHAESNPAATPQSSSSETGTSSTKNKSSRSELTKPNPEIVEKTDVKPDKEIINWLAQAKVTGVRITSKSSKVILNNKAFIPGDSVNLELGELKVIEIEPQRITLMDSRGAEYVKLF